jgi:hypothetical protein
MSLLGILNSFLLPSKPETKSSARPKPNLTTQEAADAALKALFSKHRRRRR